MNSFRADTGHDDVPLVRGDATMSIVAERFSFVVGVDTHARPNTYAIIATTTGARLDAATFPTSSSGIGRALGWILRRCQESRPLLVIEGIGSYGAAIRRAAAIRGLEVVEPLPYGSPRRRGPKDDTIDAELIARSVLGLDEALLRRPSPRMRSGPGCGCWWSRGRS